MSGSNSTSSGAQRLFAIAAFAALCGAVGVGQAQSSTDVAAASLDAPLAETARQTFVPSEQAQFEEAFSHLDGNLAEPLVPEHAVDISNIEPPRGPIAEDLGRGVASYYGRRFHGRPTANGETFDMNAMTAAHKTLPFGTRLRVTNPRNGRSVIVRVNDRGPFVRGREIDLSRAAAEEIGMIASGHATVELEKLVS